MPKHQRGEEILAIVNEKGYVTVEELAKSTYASPSTVRRDLEALERAGLLRRRHGGAESVQSLRPTLVVRRRVNQAEKKSVALKAAALVAAGSTIFIDASTTAQYMIPHLATVEGLTVYTNGADTALRLAEAGIRTVCTGGELVAESMAYVGALAADAVKKVYFDAVFFSSAGFDGEAVSDWSESETVFRRAVIGQAKKCYFLADHTKKGARYTHVVCPVTSLDGIIVDDE